MTRLHELDAYVTGELDESAAAALEEAMFDAPDDPDVAFLDRVARHGAHLAARGTFYAGVTRKELDALVAAGRVVQMVELSATSAPTVEVSPVADLFVTKLPLGRTDLERVDVEVTLADRVTTKTIRDVLVDPVDGTIYGLCERPLALLAYAAGRTTTRVLRRGSSHDVIAVFELVGQVAP